MKKLLLIGAAVLLMATSASAQSYVTRQMYMGCGGVCKTPPPLRAQDIACYRANYASTFAAQRCADEAARAIGQNASRKRTRR
jgi:hypothetical protein